MEYPARALYVMTSMKKLSSISGRFLSMTACFGLVVIAAACRAQSVNPPQFDVISIHEEPPLPSMFQWRVNFEGDRYEAKGHTVEDLLCFAYATTKDRISSLPPWAQTVRYSIQATTSTELAEQLSHSEADKRLSVHRQLVQELLHSRFGLSLHNEKKPSTVYFLQADKGGVKLRASDKEISSAANLPSLSDSSYPVRLDMNGPGEVHARNMPLSALVNLLSKELQKPVADQTGLTGSYSFDLIWASDMGNAISAMTHGYAVPHVRHGDAGVDLFTAVREQLGLQLRSGKGSVDVLVVDHVQRPTEN
ncbi:TIGR03435 family protein [Terriglobus albidus]|uniref:TIGR03435 family protein n=1 Tax=Terriglobus albidus TaxID=1592106 RepID=A0A5B9EE03_9BACT|nr:TIGR03435 family protein [Terriglobus albidus]QEE30438.1 TIGR03435 family protein [Terriglobus albidus]